MPWIVVRIKPGKIGLQDPLSEVGGRSPEFDGEARQFTAVEVGQAHPEVGRGTMVPAG